MGEVKSVDEVGSMSPVGPVLRFPDGNLKSLKSYLMNSVFILFLSCLETKALPFVPLQGDLAVPSLHCLP